MKAIPALLAIISLGVCIALFETLLKTEADLKQANARIAVLEARQNPVTTLKNDLSDLDSELNQLQISLNPQGRSQTIDERSGGVQPSQQSSQISGVKLHLEMIDPKDCDPHPPSYPLGMCVQFISDMTKDTQTSVIVLVSANLDTPEEESLLRKETSLVDDLNERLTVKDLIITPVTNASGIDNESSLSLFFDKRVNPNARTFQLNILVANHIYSIKFRLALELNTSGPPTAGTQ